MRLGRFAGMTASPTETFASCRRYNFLSFPSTTLVLVADTWKSVAVRTLTVQATCRAGVQLAHSGKCTDLSLEPTCPTSCPTEGKVGHKLSHCSPVLLRKRWFAAATETATRTSVRCGAGRAVNGSRWRTSRTARPPSEAHFEACFHN